MFSPGFPFLQFLFRMFRCVWLWTFLPWFFDFELAVCAWYWLPTVGFRYMRSVIHGSWWRSLWPIVRSHEWLGSRDTPLELLTIDLGVAHLKYQMYSLENVWTIDGFASLRVPHWKFLLEILKFYHVYRLPAISQVRIHVPQPTNCLH